MFSIHMFSFDGEEYGEPWEFETKEGAIAAYKKYLGDHFVSMEEKDGVVYFRTGICIGRGSIHHAGEIRPVAKFPPAKRGPFNVGVPRKSAIPMNPQGKIRKTPLRAYERAPQRAAVVQEGGEVSGRRVPMTFNPGWNRCFRTTFEVLYLDGQREEITVGHRNIPQMIENLHNCFEIRRVHVRN